MQDLSVVIVGGGSGLGALLARMRRWRRGQGRWRLVGDLKAEIAELQTAVLGGHLLELYGEEADLRPVVPGDPP